MAKENLGQRLAGIVKKGKAAEKKQKKKDVVDKIESRFIEITKDLPTRLEKAAGEKKCELAIFSDWAASDAEIYDKVCAKLASWCTANGLGYKKQSWVDAKYVEEWYESFVVTWDDGRLKRWRKEAKVWAKKLAKTAPDNDRPPGFDPDDDNSYPFKMPSD